jgi:hypothetical protein
MFGRLPPERLIPASNAVRSGSGGDHVAQGDFVMFKSKGESPLESI